MGLTTENYLVMKNQGAEKYVKAERDKLLKMAQQAYDAVRAYIDPKYEVRRDDVGEQLDRAFRVDEDVLEQLVKMKLRAKSWSRVLADLVVEQVWEDINGPKH